LLGWAKMWVSKVARWEGSMEGRIGKSWPKNKKPKVSN
jgi:hypothetical protein